MEELLGTTEHKLGDMIQLYRYEYKCELLYVSNLIYLFVKCDVWHDLVTVNHPHTRQRSSERCHSPQQRQRWAGE